MFGTLGSGWGCRSLGATEPDDGRTHFYGFAFFHKDGVDGAGLWAGEFDERFGGFDFDQDLVDGHGVAGGYFPRNDVSFSEPFSDVGKVKFVRHVVLSVGEGAVHAIQNAVEVREVVLFKFGARVWGVESAHANDGCFQVVEASFGDAGGDF